MNQLRRTCATNRASHGPNSTPFVSNWIEGPKFWFAPPQVVEVFLLRVFLDVADRVGDDADGGGRARSASAGAASRAPFGRFGRAGRERAGSARRGGVRPAAGRRRLGAARPRCARGVAARERHGVGRRSAAARRCAPGDRCPTTRRAAAAWAPRRSIRGCTNTNRGCSRSRSSSAPARAAARRLLPRSSMIRARTAAAGRAGSRSGRPGALRRSRTTPSRRDIGRGIVGVSGRWSSKLKDIRDLPIIHRGLPGPWPRGSEVPSRCPGSPGSRADQTPNQPWTRLPDCDPASYQLATLTCRDRRSRRSEGRRDFVKTRGRDDRAELVRGREGADRGRQVGVGARCFDTRPADSGSR